MGRSKYRDALHLTERNLTTFICSRDSLGMSDATIVQQVLLGWRSEVRRALGMRDPL
jgi:hypothetical protein